MSWQNGYKSTNGPTTSTLWETSVMTWIWNVPAGSCLECLFPRCSKAVEPLGAGLSSYNLVPSSNSALPPSLWWCAIPAAGPSLACWTWISLELWAKINFSSLKSPLLGILSTGAQQSWKHHIRVPIPWFLAQWLYKVVAECKLGGMNECLDRSGC